MSSIKQGEVYQVNFGCPRKNRVKYYLIISCNQFNDAFKTLLAIPIIKRVQSCFFTKIEENFSLRSHLLKEIKVVEKKNLITKITEVSFPLLEAVYAKMLEEYSLYLTSQVTLSVAPLRKEVKKSGKQGRIRTNLQFNDAFDHPKIRRLLKTQHLTTWEVENLIETHGHEFTIQIVNLMSCSRIQFLIDIDRINVHILVKWLADGDMKYVKEIVNTIYHPTIMALLEEKILIPEDISLWSFVFDMPTVIQHAEVVNQMENKMGIRRGVCTVWDIVGSRSPL